MALSIGDVLIQWQSAGVFDYLLPFVLIFALVFGILQKTKLFGDQKGINIIVAVVLGFLALQFDFVPRFFSEIFPRLGVALAVLLVLLILTALFINDQEKKYWNYGFAAIAVVAFIVIGAQSFDAYGWYMSWRVQEYLGWIIFGVILVGLIIAVAAGGGSDKAEKSKED